MAHNLDITDGQASFVSAREDAWHALGQVLPETFNAEQAMEAGLLGNWNVRKLPAFAQDERGNALPMPGRHAVVRDNPVVAGQVDVLGDVGDSYHIIQNEDHAEFLDALVDDSGAHFETAGAIDGGRRVFITMKLPGHVKVGGVDRIDNYLAAVNSFDGSMAFTTMITPVRIVCQNTLNVALANRKQAIKVRHTSGYKQAVNEARKVLDLSFEYLGDFQAEANRMINTTLTQLQFEEIVVREFGAPDDAHASTVTRTERKIGEMVELFSDAHTHKAVRDTAWAGFNALAEWSDHYAPVWGDDRGVARARKAVLVPAFKQKAWKLFATSL